MKKTRKMIQMTKKKGLKQWLEMMVNLKATMNQLKYYQPKKNYNNCN